MGQRVISRVGGLARDASPLLTAEAGGLRLAENVVIDRPGVARQRPGIQSPQTHAGDFRPRRMHAYDGSLIVAERDPSSAWAVRQYTSASQKTIPSGGAAPVDDVASFPQFVESRGNLYWTSQLGLAKITSAADSAAELAGIHEAPSVVTSTTTFATLDNPIPNNRARAYRVCFVKRDASGVVTRSAPSPWTRIINTSGSARTGVLLCPLPAGIVAGDEVELYASEVVPHTDVPSDIMYLSARRPVTNVEVSNQFLQINDNTLDANLGEELYTNATRDGILKANGRPLAARATALWSSCVWLGGTVGPWTAIVGIRSATGVTITPGLGGLQRFETTYSGVSGNTLTGIVDTSSVEVGQHVTQDTDRSGAPHTRIPANARVVSKTASTVTLDVTPSGSGAVFFWDVVTVDGVRYLAGFQTNVMPGDTYPEFRVTPGDPQLTAGALAYTISIQSSTVYAAALEDPFASAGAAGTAVIRSASLDDAQWAVSSTRDSALYVDKTTAGAIVVERDDRPSRIVYSKPGEPEHFPEINFIDVGTESAPVMALVPLRTSLLVFKADGIYRVAGSPPDGWRVDIIDTVSRALRAECVSALGDSAVVWTQKGVLLVDESGSRNISAGLVEDDLYDAQRDAFFGTVYGNWLAVDTTSDLLLLGTAGEAGGDYAETIYCWSPSTGGWSTWNVEAYCAANDAVGGAFYIAPQLPTWAVSIVSDKIPFDPYLGCDGPYSLSGWTYSSVQRTVTVSAAQRGAWLPKAGDWVSATVGAAVEYRRIDSVVFSTPNYVCTLESAFSNTPTSNRVAYSCIRSRIQWQAVTPGSPAAAGLWRDTQVMIDWSRYVSAALGGASGALGIGGAANVNAPVVTVGWSAPRVAAPSDAARALTPRDIARSAHVYPYVETADVGLDWRISGVAMTFEPASERTRR